MASSLLTLMILSLFLGAGCWLVFLWAVRKGEFSDIERPKHRMLDDDPPMAPCTETAKMPPPSPRRGEGDGADGGERGDRHLRSPSAPGEGDGCKDTPHG